MQDARAGDDTDADADISNALNSPTDSQLSLDLRQLENDVQAKANYGAAIPDSDVQAVKYDCGVITNSEG